MAAVFRGMFAESGTGRPALSAPPGEKSLVLGARVVLHGTDLAAGDGEDIRTQPDGTVLPATGGMSVGPTWKSLPFFTVPERLRGVFPFRAAAGEPGPDSFIWSHGIAGVPGKGSACPFATGLTLRMTSSRHGVVEPTTAVAHEAYTQAIVSTRPNWQVNEPAGPANTAEVRPG